MRATASKTGFGIGSNVNQAKFSSSRKIEKLGAFRAQLKKAKGEALTDDELWRFLRVFNVLGYDFDAESGVVVSLLHTIVANNTNGKFTNLWGRVIEHVMYANQNAKTLEIGSIPDDIREAFQEKHRDTYAPPEFAVSRTCEFDLSTIGQAHNALAIALLVGEWSENSQADIAAIEVLADSPYTTWVLKIREILQLDNAPITLHNLHWEITDRVEMWKTLSRYVFNDHLERFKHVAITVLGEKNPELELNPEDRYQATVYGKVAEHSRHLRKGIASTLAILGNYEGLFTNCPAGKPQLTALLTVRELLNEADWSRWASLDDVLPLLAEAAPITFLDKVEEALQLPSSPLQALFAQERSSFVGRTYITGLLWSLELLAWEPTLLVRVVVILGELASIDPGGKWANRPDNTLATILLPWLPQTLATPATRKMALETLLDEFPEVAWKLLLTLLPSGMRSSSGSYRPKWRESVPTEAGKGITHGEYWSQISTYSSMAVTLAKLNTDRLISLSTKLDDLPFEAQEELLQYLESRDVQDFSTEIRSTLWNTLLDIVSNHRRHSGADWALDEERVERIEKAAEKLAPEIAEYRFARWFNKDDYELFDGDGDYREQQRRLGEEQQKAILSILEVGGLDAVLSLAYRVAHPETLGSALGSIDVIDTAEKVLPRLLASEDSEMQKFAQGYVSAQFRRQGWQWVTDNDFSAWNAEQVGQFFAYLPFISETWERVGTLSVEAKEHYWRHTGASPYEADVDSTPAIRELTAVGRAYASIRCLQGMLYRDQPIDSQAAIDALDELVSDSTSMQRVDPHAVTDVIHAIQSATKVDQSDLRRIEWQYLTLLVSWSGARPLALEQRLAQEPMFFCDSIRAVYRSKNEAVDKKEPTERDRLQAESVFKLLLHWKYPPGLQGDGSFNDEHFNLWLTQVRALCEESGHLEIALARIGHVLVYCPPAPSGLWLPRAAAEALNQRDYEPMREAFRIELFNSRGAHHHSGGNDELKLADLYESKAKAVEQYRRLAAELRKLVAEYKHEASRGPSFYDD